MTDRVVETTGCQEVYTVDTELMGTPGFMSAYVLDAERPAVVDPGAATAVDPLLEALDEVGIDPGVVGAIVPTHVHLDHAGAAGALATACPNATVYCHERGLPYLTDPDRLATLVDSATRALGDVAAMYGDPDPVDPDRAVELADCDRIDLGDRHLSVVDAPGHAPHQACFLDSRDGALFAGDAAGMQVFDRLRPTTPPPNFDLAASLATIERLRERGPAVLCYGHFGAREEPGRALAAYADLLREWVETVRAAREGRSDPTAIVADLPDRFQGPTATADVAGVIRYLDGGR